MFTARYELIPYIKKITFRLRRLRDKCKKYCRLSEAEEIVHDLNTIYLFFLLLFSFSLDAGRLAKSQYPEGPVTGHLVSGFSWFPWVLEQMLGWFPTVPNCHYMLLT